MFADVYMPCIIWYTDHAVHTAVIHKKCSVEVGGNCMYTAFGFLLTPTQEGMTLKHCEFIDSTVRMNRTHCEMKTSCGEISTSNNNLFYTKYFHDLGYMDLYRA